MTSAIIDPRELPWRATPFAGVRWKKLHFDPGDGRSTVLLEFAPGAAYGTHRHPGGEEYWVLEGSLVDGDASYGPGTYVRHPPGSVHRPRSEKGCRVLVWLPHPVEVIETGDDA